MICLADIHINTRRNSAFEDNRIKMLAEALLKEQPQDLFLLGDTFDRNDPTPNDYALFYYMTHLWVSNGFTLHIICGNHDYKVIKHLWAPHINIYHEPTLLVDLGVFIVPWTHIHKWMSANPGNKQLIMLSHARCTLPPFILQETNIELMSKNFSSVILGDIHTQHFPYQNVMYCTSPTQLEYVKYTPGRHGYILDGKFKPLELPRREKIIIDSYTDIPKEVPTEHMFKYVVELSQEDSMKVKRKLLANQILEVTHKVDKVEDGNNEELQEFLQAKISVEDVLFQYLSTLPKVDKKVLTNLRERL